MKKIFKILLVVVFIALLGFSGKYLIDSNSKSPIIFTTEKAFKTSIEEKTVATGKVIPEDEVEIKPQVSGIIEKIYVKEGDAIKTGDLIAKVKVVPNEQALNSARGRVQNAQISLANAQQDFNRNKALFDKGVISTQDFQNVKLRYDQAEQEVKNARNDLQIIRQGSTGGAQAITNVRASVAGTILEIPVEKGDQVIQSNNFNDGTTVATIADLTKMIFEGKVDEAEVSKLKINMPLKVSLGAIRDKEFDAKLKFIAPKGNEEQGAVQFKIEGEVFLDDSYFVRAGYSANASIVLDTKNDILAIKEALLQFDKDTEDPYVEVKIGDQEFKRKDIEIGLSDGINVEILSGLTEEDEIKVWNKTEPIKKEPETAQD
ncbi:efflux RND transporter periplasmic adaptor subunit [Aquimarina sp. AD10]|uniref:Efflux transporter periplasmic adaptor subunit n=1 Tax=Aquimarina aggregata TaxID=1642818 RepID=A0A162YPT0_9FLAO|nr:MULTISPECIES: efflux RND transporter periplasmic adaptor subunit [Aquimarina]AXT61177.1 efflux RND transporter periplasmic adaptor subunit [Aquimarina sp. AD10]KZS39272.1 efflux transporter periplasmic adaptor subunit [Aquimarina aggregata]RKN02207.1 efflux RND transporter periplasmic adaptor subunit [Aquimarina sp. AD10]